jgi:hypothetical protein
MAASKLHTDDTPVPVLASGNGKTKTGRLWTYVRDGRPAGDTAAPAVWFAYSLSTVPMCIRNLIARVIRPHVEGVERCEECDQIQKKTKIEWKGVYSGRRGACTTVIEATGGNYAVAQALLRHNSMTTTLNVYKKAMAPEAFRSGMKLLEQSIEKK